jgi:hypothetical protein
VPRKPREPEPQPTFFLDRSLGREEVPSALRCEEGDSNPQAFRQWILSPPRLPIPPSSQRKHDTKSTGSLQLAASPSQHRFTFPSARVNLLGGCSEQNTYFGDSRIGGPDGPVVGGDARASDSLGPGIDFIYTGDPVVYAHSASELYKVDPDKLTVTKIGPFKWPGLSDQMTDIALDKKGAMIGISYDTVYSVDPKTAVCKELAPLSGSDFTGLSYIASETADGKEILLAASGSGVLSEIDPATGKSKVIGNYGGPGSSGDLVSVKGLGTYATVVKGFGGNDWLAKIDVLNGGKATLIGDIGFGAVWGLSFWKNKFYGFTEGKQFITLDTKTGKGTLVSGGGATWWGAGVTTRAPVID